MKRIFTFISIIFLSATVCMADGRKEVVTIQQVPAAGQKLLNTHFAEQIASYIIKETEFTKVEYEIRLDNGFEIELDAAGEWKKVDCHRVAVPEALIPVEILNQVHQSFPGTVIVEISKDRRGYDVELDNGLDLEFNKRFIMRIDD